MKKTAYLILVLILSFISCGKNTHFTLNGQIKDLSSDTILVYYQLPDFKFDTIIAQNGSFNYTFTPDTFTIFTLIFDSINTYPIYADKGEKVELSGSKDELSVIGTKDNQKIADYISLFKNTSKDSIKIKVDSIIESNGHSYTNIYLLDKYYVHDSVPNYSKIEELINKMSGTIKDTPYMMNLQAKLETLTKKNDHRNIYTFQNKDKKGKAFHLNTIKDKYILIDFWASWNEKSKEAQDSLVPVLKALKKEKFVIISVSLDLEKDAWLKAADRDTTQWIQVCDFTGWNNKLIKDQSIHTLPSNFLLDKNKRIIASDIRGKDLIEKVESLIEQDEAREKAKKEAARKRKRR